MRTRLSALLLLALFLLGFTASTRSQSFQPAVPGYHYEFPRDHFNHPAYQTEWWYYTGNLRAKDGHRFGFELTFFREGNTHAVPSSPWALHDVYMAHLAISDVSGQSYHTAERLNRAGPGIAGVDASARTVWNGNCQTVISPDAHHLQGVGEKFSLDLHVVPQKGPVIHGEDGISRKSLVDASHYISFTRMATFGTLQLNGTTFTVEGDAWMDHEFFSNAGSSIEIGWDWLSLQLDDDTELMLYRLRHRDGSVDPFSSGSFIDREGKVTHLALADFTMTPAATTWASKTTGAAYPLAWTVTVPKLQLQLNVTTPLKNQEFVSRFGPSYWEGAIDIAGHHGGEAIRGSGYLEMTGYAGQKRPLVTR